MISLRLVEFFVRRVPNGMVVSWASRIQKLVPRAHQIRKRLWHFAQPGIGGIAGKLTDNLRILALFGMSTRPLHSDRLRPKMANLPTDIIYRRRLSAASALKMRLRLFKDGDESSPAGLAGDVIPARATQILHRV